MFLLFIFKIFFFFDTFAISGYNSVFLLIYRIKKDGGIPQKRSEHLREKMDACSDIIGISIIVSGESIGESHAKTLRIRM